MKYFSLTDQDVRTAPGQKIVPAEEFSTLKEAVDILKQAKHENIEFKKKMEKECEELKTQAYDDGYQEGLKKLNEKMLKLDHELKQFQIEIQKKVLPIALQAARKILGEELKTHPDRIVNITMQALKPVIQHHRVKIYVNRQDLEILEENKPKIKEILEQVQSFSIEERPDIEPGGCIIETEAGIINAQLENQWRALESAFEAFMKKQ